MFSIPFEKDEDSKRNHREQTLSKIPDSSEEDNELGDETISGENDVEYAEFSLSVRTSPKEQIQNNPIENVANANGTSEASVAAIASMNGFDDFMALPIAALPSSNVSSRSLSLSLPLSFSLDIDYYPLCITGTRNRYRTPITSASVFDTLLEGPKMSFAILGGSGNTNSNRNSSTSDDSSSMESLRNGLYFHQRSPAQPDNQSE